ncbi:hypothetical protein J1614_002741 [Plenodomus biglobosus]|nr:hypothetical protein J1614_002741 [Plenodomus biglobosus]
MMLAKRYNCIIDDDGFRQCYSDDSFWYTDKGIIIKWIVLITFFLIFFGWFVGGYIHAKHRLRKGLPLLAYHGFLVSRSQRRRYGQAGPPQNHFTFYQTQNPYQPNAAYVQRQDGAWAEPPPLYQNSDAPPQYYPPPRATKMDPNQRGGVELPQYGVPGQQSGVVGAPGLQGGQMSGVVGAGPAGHGDVEQGGSSTNTQALPARPETAKSKLMGVVGRFRR